MGTVERINPYSKTWKGMSNMTEYKAAYKSLNSLKADTVALLQNATCDWTRYNGLPATIVYGYAERFETVEHGTEKAEEFPQLLKSIMGLGKGRFSMHFHGSLLWVGNGFYGKDGTKQYKWETRENRQGLKKLGLRWSPKYSEWYYKREEAATVDSGKYSGMMDDLLKTVEKLNSMGVQAEVHGIQTTTPVVWAVDADNTHSDELLAMGLRYSDRKGAWWIKAAA